jgi:hypothetical protein
MLGTENTNLPIVRLEKVKSALSFASEFARSQV